MSKNINPTDESSVLSSFTSEEKQAFFRTLIATSSVDGNVDANERAVIEDIMEELGLSEDERQTAIQLGQNETFAVLRAMNDTKKEQLGDFIARVIYADSKIYPFEEKFFKTMKIYLGLPDKDY